MACCKPKIRIRAQAGDYVVGLGPKGRGWPVVYAMQVTDTMTFDDYWHDPDFRVKRPNILAGGEKALGDNIYHWDPRLGWVQERSHHSNYNGMQDQENTDHDTKDDRVLISDNFIYWGGDFQELPDSLSSLITGRAYRRFRETEEDEREVVGAFIEWFNHFPERGRIGMPYGRESMHHYSPRRRKR